MQALVVGRSRCVAALLGLWRESPARCVAAVTALEVPLRPSRRVRQIRWLLLSLVLVYVIQLLLGRHWLVAPLVALLAAAACLRHGHGEWSHLRMEPDGRLLLCTGAGRVQQVWLAANGLRLGAHVLLVLRGGSGCWRVCLGPDNVGPDALAALKQRLPGGTEAPVTALHSVPAQGSKSGTRS
jgi:hypothetical protein